MKSNQDGSETDGQGAMAEEIIKMIIADQKFKPTEEMLTKREMIFPYKGKG